MEKSILDMLLELTTLVHEFNAISDSKCVQQSLSIDISKKTFAVCKWDEPGEKPKVIHSFSGGLVPDLCSNPKQHLQNVIYVISNEVSNLRGECDE